MPWKKMLAWVTGQIEDSLRQKLEFVLEENRVYRALLDRHSPQWRLQDTERKALAQKGRPLGELLAQVLTIVQPATLLKWLSLTEIPSAWDLLSFQQVGDRLLPNDDLVGQRSPGNLYVGTAVSLGTGIRALGALAPGDGHAAIATQATVQRC
jgi:hypothetical protein